MGMTSYVVGFKPPDEKWKKMKAAWDACQAAGTDPPEAVEEFFGGEEPDDAGVEIRLGNRYSNPHPAVTRHTGDGEDGYEIDLTKLPPDVKIIRFVNSY